MEGSVESKVKKIIKGRIRYYADDAGMSIPVVLEDGSEAEIGIPPNARVKVYFDERYNKAKAHVTWQKK